MQVSIKDIVVGDYVLYRGQVKEKQSLGSKFQLLFETGIRSIVDASTHLAVDRG